MNWRARNVAFSDAAPGHLLDAVCYFALGIVNGYA